MGDLSGVQVLVIGASGFLGGRLAERLLLEQAAGVRAMFRRVSVSRLARLPVEVTVGDVLDASSIAAAAQGCRVLFNCAKGTGPDAARRRATEIEGVRNVIEAGRRVGARVVHVSSMAVYDLPREGDVNEWTPDAPPGDPYTDAKLEGERLALQLGASFGVPVTIVQPTVVYGPNAGVHGSEILEELRTSRMITVDNGSGICNAVYVDDVITAMLLAATSDRAPGERFLISGPEHPTWRDFFGAFENMLGGPRIVSLSEAEALALWRQSRQRVWLVPEMLRAIRENQALRARLLSTREGRVVRWVVERTFPRSFFAPERWSEQASHSEPASEAPLIPLRPWLVRYLARKARVRIDKARDLLGYQPVFHLNEGMRVTEQWARWAGLLD